MKKLISALLFALGLIPATLFAVPAKQAVMKFTQPDGQTIELRKIGDERASVTVSAEGYPVTVDANGFYCYALIERNASGTLTLVPTALSLGQSRVLGDAEKAMLETKAGATVGDLLRERADNSPLRQEPVVASRAGKGIGLMYSSFLGYTELKGLVILAQYTDVQFSEGNDNAFFSRMLNNEGFAEYGGTGSARDYFMDSSMGQFTPTFDVYGPVTLPHAMAYYGGNNAGGSDQRAAEMIRDACKGLDGEINFADYDMDGDGYVDNVFVFYAGFGEASYGSADTVWPHQWNLRSGGITLKLDGVYVDRYACSNELEYSSGKPVPDGVGTFVHEFSHVMGLPDLYATRSDGEWTPSVWSVLDQGPYNNDGRTPPAYSVFERYALGWIEPQVIDGPASITLKAINETNEGCIIPTANVNEFFLLENRQQTGWDKYIPGHGMLVWHIDYNPSVWTSNRVNDTQSHNYVDIEEACGKWYSIRQFSTMNAFYKALAGYAFPGTQGVTSFTDDTKPSMRTWAGAALSLPLTDITETGGVIDFNVAGGRCDAAVPVVTEPKEFGKDWFKATWEPAEGAQSYLLTVTCDNGELTEGEETATFGNPETMALELPEGWDFIGAAGSTYSSVGNYGAAAPSLKLNKDGSGFATRTFGADINGLSFWLKGVLTNSSTAVNVSGLVDGSWKHLETFVPSSKATTVTLSDLPAGVRALQITLKLGSGSVAIDDVRVKFLQGGFVPLNGYNKLSVDTPWALVSGLSTEVDTYKYKVCAIDINGRKTAWSEEQTVKMGSSNGINDVLVSAGASFALEGHTITYSGAACEKITLADLCGRTVATATADATGRAVVHAPAGGVYLLVTTSRTFKIVL